MSSFKIFAVSDRKLCGGRFLEQIEKIAEAKPSGIILREKDLPEEEYEALARKVMELCERHAVECILHTFTGAASRLGCRAIQLPLPILRRRTDGLARFDQIGTSAHSPEEAAEAERLGASYVIAGHVFATDCKKDLAPRGLSFLKAVREAAGVPVYAIGGIGPENVREIAASGADGVCIMSGLMRSRDPADDLSRLAGQIGA